MIAASDASATIATGTGGMTPPMKRARTGNFDFRAGEPHDGGAPPGMEFRITFPNTPEQEPEIPIAAKATNEDLAQEGNPTPTHAVIYHSAHEQTDNVLQAFADAVHKLQETLPLNKYVDNMLELGLEAKLEKVTKILLGLAESHLTTSNAWN